MSLINQLDVYNAGRDVEIQANRAIQQANNSISSALADYATWAATVPAAGFDADTLAAIDARKTALQTAALTVLATATAAIEAL